MTSTEKKSKVKIVIQQCLSARLELPDDEGQLTIGRGMIAFVCFLAGADEEDALKAADIVCKVRLSETDDAGNSKRVAILDLPGDLLIIPQATLGGKLKGKALQYHSNIEKDFGRKLYGAFCEKLATIMDEGRLQKGFYGARQVLSMETNGPFTHVLEL